MFVTGTSPIHSGNNMCVEDISSITFFSDTIKIFDSYFLRKHKTQNQRSPLLPSPQRQHFCLSLLEIPRPFSIFIDCKDCISFSFLVFLLGCPKLFSHYTYSESLNTTVMNRLRWGIYKEIIFQMVVARILQKHI